MHNSHYDDMFYTPQYIKGLKEEIRGTVEAHMPTSVHKASIIAKVQHGVMERSKARTNRNANQPKPYFQPKPNTKQPQQPGSLWRDRQLRGYRKASGLCYSCGEKFVPGHMEVCPKRNRPQANAIIMNDLDRELSDEVLNDVSYL